MENDSIQWDFNYEEEEFILANSLVLIGILEKLKKILLDSDTGNETQEEAPEENSEESEETDENTRIT